MILTPHLYQGGRVFAPLHDLIAVLRDLSKQLGGGVMHSTPIDTTQFDQAQYFARLVPWLDPSLTAEWLKLFKSDANPEWDWTFSELESPNGLRCTIATLDGSTMVQLSATGLQRLGEAALVASAMNPIDPVMSRVAIATMLADEGWWTPHASHGHAPGDRLSYGGTWVPSPLGPQPEELLSALRYDICVYLLNGYDLAYGWESDDYAVVPWNSRKRAACQALAASAGLVRQTVAASSRVVHTGAVLAGALAGFVGGRLVS